LWFVLAPRTTSAQSMPQPAKPLFTISLAQWSIHRALESKSVDPLDFARIAKHDHNIDAIEYVSTFYKANATNSDYLKQLKQRADDHGVRSMLIMCDEEGDLGDPEPASGRPPSRIITSGSRRPHSLVATAFA
jgi:hypothetical protein